LLTLADCFFTIPRAGAFGPGLVEAWAFVDRAAFFGGASGDPSRKVTDCFAGAGGCLTPAVFFGPEAALIEGSAGAPFFKSAEVLLALAGSRWIDGLLAAAVLLV